MCNGTSPSSFFREPPLVPPAGQPSVVHVVLLLSLGSHMLACQLSSLRMYHRRQVPPREHSIIDLERPAHIGRDLEVTLIS